MRKTEADTTRSPLRCPRTHGARRTQESQQWGPCFPSQGASFSFPGCCPTAAKAPRGLGSSPPHPRGHQERRAGAGTHAARPPRPHPRIPRIPAGGVWARVGARRAEACRGTAAKGGARWGMLSQPYLVPSLRGLLRRKTLALKLEDLGLTR